MATEINLLKAEALDEILAEMQVNVDAAAGSADATALNVIATGSDVVAAENARDLAETYAGVDHRAATWAALSAISGLTGDVGYVSPDDAGTHTDPIATGTVPNEGLYEWAADGLGSAQAERTGSTGLATKAEQADLDVVASDLATAEVGLAAAEYDTSFSNYLKRQKEADLDKPMAAIIVLLGQSLNARREPFAVSSPPNTVMPVGGASVEEFEFRAINKGHVANFKEVASFVPYDESGAMPTPGIVYKMLGSQFDKFYAASAAAGGSPISGVSSGGLWTNTDMIVRALCNAARSDGYAPYVVYTIAQGEADGLGGTSEQEYYDIATYYCRNVQALAAQAMRRPDYTAPIIWNYPLQTKEGESDRDVKEAIRKVVQDVPGCMNVGGIYHWGSGSDRVHSTGEGSYRRGEACGELLRDWFDNSLKFSPPIHMIDVQLSGSSFVVTFNKPVIRDATVDYAIQLNPTNQRDGFEWFDNGTNIAITDLVYNGFKVTGTLASAPTGTVEQQVLRIAEHDTNGLATNNSGLKQIPGSLVRSETPRTVIYDGATEYQWASPQRFTNVRTA